MIVIRYKKMKWLRYAQIVKSKQQRIKKRVQTERTNKLFVFMSAFVLNRMILTVPKDLPRSITFERTVKHKDNAHEVYHAVLSIGIFIVKNRRVSYFYGEFFSGAFQSPAKEYVKRQLFFLTHSRGVLCSLHFYVDQTKKSHCFSFPSFINAVHVHGIQ